MPGPEEAFAALGTPAGRPLPVVLVLRATVSALPLLTDHLEKLSKLAEAESRETAAPGRLHDRLASAVTEFEAAFSEVQGLLKGVDGPAGTRLAALAGELMEWCASFESDRWQPPRIGLLDEAEHLAYQLWRESSRNRP